jgi:long-chain fatty acid transport protein
MTNTFAVYYNPAALGGVRSTTIQADASILFRAASYDRPESALSPSPTFVGNQNYKDANTGHASLLNATVLPFLGVSTDFGGKLGGLRGGYAFYIPYGGSADWNKRNDAALSAAVPGSIDGPQRWHNISGQILAIYNTIALAYELPAGFSLGASISPIIHTAKTVRARNLDGSDNTVNGNRLIEGRSLIEVSGINLGASFGLHYDPFDDHRFKIGFSYTSQPGFGDTTMSGKLTQQLGNSPEGMPSDVDLIQAYPDLIRFGFSWQMAKQWELHSDFQYERWSVFKSQCLVTKGIKCNVDPVTGADRTPADQQAMGKSVILNIPANWQDSIGARIGAVFSPMENLGVFASTAFGTPATRPDTINAAAIDAFRIYATLGARMRVGKHITLAGSYNHVFFLDVNTNGTSTLYKFQTPSASPSADGVYKTTVGFFTADVAYTF